MKTKNSLLLALFLLLVACQITKKGLNDAVLYQQSIQNAIYPDASKVSDKLVPVVRQNQNLVWKNILGEDYVLVVTWKQNVSYYQQYLDSAFYNTGKYPIWITSAHELKLRMRQEKLKDADRRLIQLLGLPPNSVYSYFVEFWVKPVDLFRPCPDNEITDTKCETCFPKQTDSAHVSWINENRISRYYQCDLSQQYPWTQLGYTYDWNPKNKSHVGLSEFVIGTNKNIVVKAIYTTEEYLSSE